MSEPGIVACPVCGRDHTEAQWCPRKIASHLLKRIPGEKNVLNHADTQKLIKLQELNSGNRLELLLLIEDWLIENDPHDRTIKPPKKAGTVRGPNDNKGRRLSNRKDKKTPKPS